MSLGPAPGWRLSLSALGVIVLAAGAGTRMKSKTHKVLHPVCGRPMGLHVIEAARELQPAKIAVVVGHQREAVEAALAAPDITFVHQPTLDGTGGAVARCREAMADCDEIMVLNGDCPLITPATLKGLQEAGRQAPLAFVSCIVESPGRLGRVIRDTNGHPERIVEAIDFESPDGPAEINAGQYVFKADWLWVTLSQVPLSPKGEYYLTYLIGAAAASRTPGATVTADPDEALGVDDRVKLAEAEAVMRRRLLETHMLNGVTIRDPATTWIDAGVTIGADSVVLPNTHILGASAIAEDCVIGPGSTLRNATIGPETTVESSTVEDSSVGARCKVGPMSHIRGGARIGDDCELHNYAEVKNSVFGRGVKMHHFSYMGDADVGDEANIAAGSITCNFDGVRKHRTTIGARAFIGCDTMLIAPVTIGEGAYTATGAVVTHDVAPGETVAGVPAKPFARRKPPEAQD